jgi:predicted enzyme related to lactoylglutathione lyase
VDAATERATALGGHVLLGPLDIPGSGRVAVLRDPDGATFGLFDPVPA